MYEKVPTLQSFKIVSTAVEERETVQTQNTQLLIIHVQDHDAVSRENCYSLTTIQLSDVLKKQLDHI